MPLTPALNLKTPWQRAAEALVAEEAMKQYKSANTDRTGKPYKKHRQYSLPDWCQPLLDAALREEDEVETKRIMMLVRMGCYSIV
jgi:hypothetical protein